MNTVSLRNRAHIALLLTGLGCISPPSWADDAGAYAIELRLRDHLFHPAEQRVPAGRQLRLIIINEDDSPEEFESYAMNRKKIIPGNRRGVIFIDPLEPGEYPFYGEYNMTTAHGKFIAVDADAL